MAATTPVTIEQAAAVLGLSTSTVRRRIRAGLLRVEEVRRPQGLMRLVYLPDAGDSPVNQVADVTAVAATALVTGESSAMIAYTRTLLIPLVDALERSQATVKEQAETIGELRAENRALLAAPDTGGQVSPQWLFLARWWPLGLWVLGSLGIIAVLLAVRW